jgi:hypothetical protein
MNMVSNMDFIEKQRQAQADKRASMLADYRKLCRKLAAGKLTTKDEDAMEQAINGLGITLEQVAADRDVFRRVAEYADQLAALPALKAKLGERLAEYEKCAKETQAAAAAMQIRLDGFRVECRAIQAKANDLQGVLDKSKALQSEHWQLLGHEDPAITARRKHLVQVVYGRPTDAPYHVMEFESIMASPIGNPINWAEFIPAPGQTPEQLAELVARAKQLIGAKLPGRYLFDGVSKAVANVNLVFQPAGLYGSGATVTDYNWQRLPDQTQDELDGLIKKLESNWKRERRAAHDSSIVGASGGRVLH